MSKTSTEEYTTLELSSAKGPVYRKIKNTPLRDARLDEIPVIDVAGMFSSSSEDRKPVAQAIHNAATNNGFFYIKNHGVPQSLIDSAYQSSLEFFRQPKEIKEKVNARLSPGFTGWKPPNTQRINSAESIDIRESFSIRYNPKYDLAVCDNLDAIPSEVRNCMTEDEFCWEQTLNLPQFKTSAIEYWRATLSLAKQLTRSFALALSLPEDAFDSKIKYPDAGVGINYYPTITITPTTSDQVSIGSHTDFQLFTILWQDSAGGLQVLNKDGEWLNAAPIEGTFVVNIGDYLQRITNDRYVSTVHRARNLSGKERVSMPMFFGFGLNERCGVLESCVSEERPARYEEISCKEWVELRVKAMHTTD
ncbi:2OG-Fe(II) oxygenase [Tricladium varicosporioides]|nr:2OG-Fe(II) oxygenase [Hymenoscyphus varicosporioides]